MPNSLDTRALMHVWSTCDMVRVVTYRKFPFPLSRWSWTTRSLLLRRRISEEFCTLPAGATTTSENVLRKLARGLAAQIRARAPCLLIFQRQQEFVQIEQPPPFAFQFSVTTCNIYTETFALTSNGTWKTISTAYLQKNIEKNNKNWCSRSTNTQN